jgi:hypothetical protein
MGNVICSTMSLKYMDLNVFFRIRGFTVFITMFGEFWIMKVLPSISTRMSVLILTGGTFLTVIGSKWSIFGYLFVLSSNIFSALTNIYMKDRSSDPELQNHGTLFYNSLLVLLPMISFASISGDLEIGWKDGTLIYILTCCFLNIFLLYGQNFCMYYNSVTSILVISSFKHVILSYSSEKTSDFTSLNFLGNDIFLIGSFLYFANIFKPNVDEINRYPIKKF